MFSRLNFLKSSNEAPAYDINVLTMCNIMQGLSRKQNSGSITR